MPALAYNDALDVYSLRKKIRKTRRQLRPDQQNKAAYHLSKTLGSSPLFLRSQHIAFYLPNDGEIDPSLLMARAWQHNKTCYLPVLAPLSEKLLFVRHDAGDALMLNQFNIPEPIFRQQNTRQPWALDLVITPLVAFDIFGNRLGMGGGYYDHTFAFLHSAKTRKKPKLIGIAHSFQQTANLPCQSWDVPLDGVFTDKNRFMFETSRN